MAFPAEGKVTLRRAWEGITSQSTRIKRIANELIAASNITRKNILDYANSLTESLATLDGYVTTPGLLAYAQNELNDATINLSAEFTTMRTQIVATQDWIVANFPKDAAGNLAVYAFDANKRYTDINLTSGQLTAFKTQLNALVATINQRH